MTVTWDRRVIPQWNTSLDSESHPKTTTGRISHAQLTPLSKREEDLLQSGLEEFSEFNSIGVAADILRFGYCTTKDHDLESAAHFVINYEGRIPVGLKKLASLIITKNQNRFFISPISESDERKNINQTKKWLSNHPRDGLTWLDLGRMQATLGNLKSATKSVKTALNLNPHSRTVLRGSARFFLHARDPEIALDILNRNPRTLVDPWLIAGHIAISSIIGKNSNLIKKANHLINAKIIHPRDLAELASSLATVNLQNGSYKEAKKLFNFSLKSPNQNSLAQAEWAIRKLSLSINMPEEWMENQISPEALYYRQLFSDQFEEALLSAIEWHKIEPFASRPMISASFIAGISGNLEDACNYAKSGLITEPNNPMLLNNLAFALGAKGEITSSEKIIEKVLACDGKNLNPHTLANLGMLAYLRKEFALGEQLYTTSIEEFKKSQKTAEALAAASFQAHFAKATQAPNWELIINKTHQAIDKSRSPLASSIFKRLINTNATSPINSSTPTQPRKWHYDQSKNILIFS